MLRQISPRLRRANVMLNSFGSCISDAPKEFSWTPEMPFGEIISQPRMFLHQFESRIPLKQLQCLADRHCWWQFDKQVDMVNSDMQLINFASMFQCNLSDKSFAVNFDSKKLEGVPSVFTFPHKVEGILPEGVFKTLQIHFFAPKVKASKKAHANFVNLFQEGNIYPLYANKHIELNIEDGNSSIGLKAEVPLPLM